MASSPQTKQAFLLNFKALVFIDYSLKKPA